MRVNIEKLARFDFTRRELLQAAGAFVLGATISVPRMSYGQEVAPPQGAFDPNVFLRIAPDNTVTLLSKHLEMGQGATTGMAMMVAEELGADWALMKFEHAASNPALYNNLLFGPLMATGGELGADAAGGWRGAHDVRRGSGSEMGNFRFLDQD